MEIAQKKKKKKKLWPRKRSEKGKDLNLYIKRAHLGKLT